MNEYVLLRGADLTMYNSMRIHSTCDTMYLPASIDALTNLLERFSGKRVVLLGRGSNVIFTREHYDENTIFISTRLLNDIEADGGVIHAQCGAELSDLAYFAMTQGSKGFEFLEDIPGTVGGALMMNAGTHNDTIANIVLQVTYFSPAENSVLTVSQPEAANFFYTRDSVFAREGCAVLSCGFRTSPGEYLEVLDRMLDIKRKRFAKQPRDYFNAGSVFKRPQKDGKDIYVWSLMEELGLRGYTVGSAQVSQKHPGFIVNLGGATCEDVLNLIEHCKKTVFQRFGVSLELEWKLI